MTTTAKVLQVLRLFNDERKSLRAADVVALLRVSPATAYRYMADLEAAGLIERASISDYVLGSSIVEMDPLIAAATDIMKSLAERTGGACLLSRLHGRKVLCVHRVQGRLAPPQVSYERGRAMSLYRGATSKAILAHLPPVELRAIVREQRAELHAAGLPTSFDALTALLEPIREKKVCATRGEVDSEACGWAAPIHLGKTLIGSLSVVISAQAPDVNVARTADQLLRAALRIEGRLEAGR
jgi:DNA-binding IclR family transcriptional regulator